MSHGGRSKKHKGGHDDEAHPDERWLVTYADMLTLLLVLFIVLYAMSVVDPTKFVKLKTGLSAVFDPGASSVISSPGGGITSSDDSGTDTQESTTPNLINPKQDPSATSTTTILDEKTAAAVRAVERAQTQAQATRVQGEVDSLNKTASKVKAALAADGLQKLAKFTIDERGLVITIVTNSVVFGGNSATLLTGGQEIIDQVAPALLKLDNHIEVDGHTNQQNVSTYPYPSGWELSSARASAVVRYLIGQYNFPASRMSAVGYSDQRPLYPASDPRSITGNRRVDLVVVSDLSAADRALLKTLANPVDK